MHVLSIYKDKENQIKNKGAGVAAIFFSHFKSMVIIPGAHKPLSQ